MINTQRDNYPENPVLRLISGQREAGPVCSSPLCTVTRDQMKASGFNYQAAHTDPMAMVMLASTAYTSIGFQGIRIPFDLCVEAEACGCKLRYGDSESPPSIVGKAFEKTEDLLVPDDIFQKGRFRIIFEAARVLNDKFGKDVTLYTGITGPLTLLGHLFDADMVMRWFIKDPQRVNYNLKRAADFLAAYADRLFEAGGHVLFISDPTASGELLSRKYFQRHLIPIYQRMREKIQMPIILHICGNTVGFLDLLPKTGFEGFSFEGPSVPVQEARKHLGDKMLLVGNIPTYDVLLFGTPDEVYETSLLALQDGVDVLAPACGIPIQTPIQNLKAMVRAVEAFRENNKGRE